jgi:lysophospholipase L1-like esterase
VVPKPEGVTRIWALGGSSTYDVHAPTDAHTWPARLEAELVARGESVDVLNGGRPGEVLMGSWDQLVALNDTLQPDLVVLYHGPNDLRQALQMELGQEAELVCDQDVLPPIDVAIFRWLARSAGPHPIPAEWHSRRLQRWEDIERNLRDVLKQARRMGLRAVVASHALGPSDEEGMLRYAEHMGLGPEGIVEAFEGYNRVARRLAEGERAVFVDLAAAVPDDPALWGDPSHFGPEGSALAGRVLADALIEERVLR